MKVGKEKNDSSIIRVAGKKPSKNNQHIFRTDFFYYNRVFVPSWDEFSRFELIFLGLLCIKSDGLFLRQKSETNF